MDHVRVFLISFLDGNQAISSCQNAIVYAKPYKLHSELCFLVCVLLVANKNCPY